MNLRDDLQKEVGNIKERLVAAHTEADRSALGQELAKVDSDLRSLSQSP